MRQTDFVISEYQKPEFKHYSLDLVNAVVYLAYMDPKEARELDYSTEYFHERRTKKKQKMSELVDNTLKTSLIKQDSPSQLLIGNSSHYAIN